LDASQVLGQPGLAVGVGARDQLQIRAGLSPVDVEELRRRLKVGAGQARLSELDHSCWCV
jgi:hypothetical protein